MARYRGHRAKPAPRMLGLAAGLVLLFPGGAAGYVRFQPTEDLYQTTSEPVAVAVGDVNSDWRPDIVMGTFSNGFGRESPDDLKLLVFLQRPDHTFERQTPLSGSGTLSVAVADMDGDGKNEILSAAGGGVGLGAWRHTSDGSFSYSQIATACCDLVAANMDSDSRDEVVAASTGGIWIVDWIEADNTYAQKQLTTRWIPEMDVGDVNSDGFQDVVAYGHHRFSFFMQDSEGRFTEQSFEVSDVTHDGLATADMTADNREDVVVAASHNTPYSRLKVFPQLPQGGISPNPIVYDSYDLPESLRALDMTGDGREDVVVLHDGWMRIGVYEQSATGGLGPEQLFPKRNAGNYPYPDLRLADLDADARPDIAVMDQHGLFIMRRLPPPATPYVRPKGASPLRLPLVPSYQECRSPDAHHGPPLAYRSCSPGAPESAFLTLGTPDANGKPANGIGWIRIAAALGDPGTPENEADMRIDMSVSDVRKKVGLSDYEGELYEAMTFRVTDGDSRQAGERDSATGEDVFFAISAPCAPTGEESRGSTCSLFTTLNTVIPGAVSERNRAIWEVSKLEVYDGGADGVGVSDDDNTPFLAQGIFVP